MTEQTFADIPDTCAPRIAILNEHTANQIAAGEVIERPASVVKELVENAIDAGARRITIDLERSGKQMIRVTDDGCGMSQEDAILSLQRHATSKIRSASDLEAIATMGFRGEALPSIASVSRMSIVSRSEEALADHPGIRVAVSGGAIEDVEEVGARPGTSITVENLFYNVPARFKFLKSDSTEMHQIIDMVQRQALARPDIAFRLLHDGQEQFSASGNGDISDVCVEVYGRQVARKLLRVEFDGGIGVRVTGMLGPPETMRGSRGGQHFFVNRRFVRDRAIARALDSGYRAVQTIHGQQFPVCVILVDVDPSAVDVNVSPTKTEVRFVREREVFSAVYHAVQQTLIQQGGLVAPNVPLRVVEESAQVAPGLPPQTGDDPPAWFSPFANKAAPDPAAGYPSPQQGAPGYDPFEDDPQTAPAFAPQNSSYGAIGYSSIGAASDALPQPGLSNPGSQHRDQLAGMRVLAQTRNMYILAQTDSALLLIDQHIAHERVLYERLLSGQAGSALAVQHLVIPVTLDLGRREALLVEQRLDDLKRAGFALEPFGVGTFLVRSAPAKVAQKQSVERVIRAIIDELLEKSVSRRLLVPAEEVLITASCKMAVKAGDPLTLEEMRALTDDLLACENPYTCPHGRPIIIEMFNNDLDRKFGRI